MVHSKSFSTWFHVLTTAASQANATQLLASQLFKDVRQLAHLLLWIYKITIWSKGDEFISESSGNGTVLLTRETETERVHLEIPVDADILWNNKQIRRDILGTVTPLSGGVDAITVADTMGDSVSIETSDFGYFNVPELPPEKDRVEERAYLNVVAPAFERGQGWRMRRREKAASEWYYVMDVEFLNDVDNGALRFGKYDVLECSVSTIETSNEDGTTSSRREIVKVHHPLRTRSNGLIRSCRHEWWLIRHRIVGRLTKIHSVLISTAGITLRQRTVIEPGTMFLQSKSRINGHAA